MPSAEDWNRQLNEWRQPFRQGDDLKGGLAEPPNDAAELGREIRQLLVELREEAVAGSSLWDDLPFPESIVDDLRESDVDLWIDTFCPGEYPRRNVYLLLKLLVWHATMRFLESGGPKDAEGIVEQLEEATDVSIGSEPVSQTGLFFLSANAWLFDIGREKSKLLKAEQEEDLSKALEYSTEVRVAIARLQNCVSAGRLLARSVEGDSAILRLQTVITDAAGDLRLTQSLELLKEKVQVEADRLDEEHQRLFSRVYDGKTVQERYTPQVAYEAVQGISDALERSRGSRHKATKMALALVNAWGLNVTNDGLRKWRTRKP